MKKRFLEELKKLGIPRLFVVTFDKEGGYKLTEGYSEQKFYAAYEFIIFYLSNGNWIVRYMDVNGNVYPEYVAKFGLRLSISDNCFNVFKDKKKIESVEIDIENFHDSFEKAFSEIKEKSTEYNADLYVKQPEVGTNVGTKKV